MILCVGENTFGQLGNGNQIIREQPCRPSQFGLVSEDKTQPLDHDTVQDVQCGSKFSVILHINGNISLCGSINGINFPLISPVKISYPLKCIQIACGNKHVLALMEGGHVLSWGVGYFGQLGFGDNCCYDNAKLIQALEPNRLGCKVVQIACGGSHSGVVTERGTVFMWGLNKQGQCGLGSKEVESVSEPSPLDSSMKSVKVRSLVCGRNHSAILTDKGGVYTYGAATYGRLGIGKDRDVSLKKVQGVPLEVKNFRNNPVKHIASGDFHMLALTHDSNLHSWGKGIDGQLGHWGSVENLNTPRKMDIFDMSSLSSRGGSPVVEISCGSSWSTAITAKGALYVWGNGDGGQLGIEPPKNLPFLNEDDTPLLSTLCTSINSLDVLLSPLKSPFHSINNQNNQKIDVPSKINPKNNLEAQIEENKYLTHSCSFDSRLNVLVPFRFNETVNEPDFIIEKVRCGGNHMIMFLREIVGGKGSAFAGSK
mmetsp:Transcript_22585/g.21799  ORF Transcript_22585/g.21799 Transcript_22585/m.21799 type:complete len:482 (-) Transcript_22585:334-1779(-)